LIQVISQQFVWRKAFHQSAFDSTSAAKMVIRCVRAIIISWISLVSQIVRRIGQYMANDWAHGLTVRRPKSRQFCLGHIQWIVYIQFLKCIHAELDVLKYQIG